MKKKFEEEFKNDPYNKDTKVYIEKLCDEEKNKALNKRFEGAQLFEIDFTPKGTKTMETVTVWAKNELDASNYLILNHIWGKQHAIRLATSNLLKNK